MGKLRNVCIKTMVLMMILVSCQDSGRTIIPESTINPSEVSKAQALSSQLGSEEWVESILDSMTLEEKVGQMIQAERRYISPSQLKKYCIGSVFSGGGSAPGNNSKEAWTDMCKEYQEASANTRLGIPIIYGIDSVHGHNTVNGAVVFPHNIGLGAADDIELMNKIGAVTAKEMLATGVTWNFAPCIAVSRDERWGRVYESYSENPELVSKLLVPYIKGLQDNGVTACAKHYAGDGGTVWGTGDNNYFIDQGETKVSQEEFEKIHLSVYKDAIKAGVKTIMVSFSSYEGVKMHENKHLIQDVLKGEMGFKGVVVSDWEGIHQIKNKDFYQQIVSSVNAGLDMFMEPQQWKQCFELLKSAVEKGDISQERIDDAVKRILTVKIESGLIKNPLGDQSKASENLGAEENIEVAREAVRKSLVLLKNNNILPLKKTASIFVTGPGADNVGLQCGGWTKTWQGGADGGKNKWMRGTTILDGLKKIAAQNGGTIITNPKEAKNADVTILVLAEKPYAEGQGDDGSLSLYDGCAHDKNKQAITQAKEANHPTITILVSGRPRIITEELKDWDAFVEAWLPGTEGDAIADVLYGDYDFTGKLPLSWPKTIDQLPLNNDNLDGKDPLFPYGFGLQYKVSN
jgi:beta-glucosidase